MTILEQLHSDFQNQGYGDWFVLITGIIYVILATRNNPLCWVFGIFSTAVLAYITVAKYQLHADGMLNAFYVVMGFIGLFNWKFKSGEKKTQITSMSARQIVGYFITGCIVSILGGIVLRKFTGAMATTLDSFTTVFSVIATIWLVKRKIENWILWIVVDIAYVYLYITRGAVLNGLLLSIYTALAFSGYIQWRRMQTQQL